MRQKDQWLGVVYLVTRPYNGEVHKRREVGDQPTRLMSGSDEAEAGFGIPSGGIVAMVTVISFSCKQ